MPEPSDYSTEFADRLRGLGVDARLIGALRGRRVLDRATADVITVEDVITHKLLARRSRDIDDLTDIMSELLRTRSDG